MTRAPHAPRRARRGVAAVLLGCAGTGLLSGALVVAAPAAHAAPEQGCGGEAPRYLDEEPPALAQLGAQRAGQLATGDGVTVAVVDSGVDDSNPHLAGAVLAGTDVVRPGTADAGRKDTWGHGTTVAGIIAARPVEGSGVRGLAPGARILPVRVYYGEDSQAERDGTDPDPGRIAEGIRWAVDHGAQVVNVSMSSDADDPALRAAVEHATSNGSLVVASAGNRNTADDDADGPRFPAAYPDVLAVAAVDRDLNATDASIHGDHVDVAAPGQDVLGVYRGAGDCWFAVDAPAPSWSTAYVSAAAALVAQRFPDETPAQWAYRLEVTAARAVAHERTRETGWGVVRPDQALQHVDDGTAVGPPNPTSTDGPPVAAVTPVAVPASVDPLEPVRATAVWWVLAATTVVTLVALAWRLVGPRRSR
ncbi:S8 family serine peptidase [Cellulomonas uda]|uniref:S8 family serine peptidase n=1 Tax=Cellulomonas uda TaxID=1714 RepID=UPI00141BF443|nr:S8 family serine peptidase [Cellulomonas uda]NII67993.1 type VII secretion-associated serine protease mycosin [Cellulomonas uda]